MIRFLTGKCKYFILTSTLVIAVLSALVIPLVEINYDMTKYLPSDSNTALGLEVLEDSFGNHAAIQIMIESDDFVELLMTKDKIKSIPLVKNVFFIDDIIPYMEKLEFLPPETIRPFYYENNALLTVTIDADDYCKNIEYVLQDIEIILEGKPYAIRGEALNNIEARQIAENETYKIILYILPIILLILLLASKSFFEPIIILIPLSVAIVINMATNYFLPNISFITLAIAAALQLAISLDYSLFLLHRYYEERKKDVPVLESIITALKSTFKTVSASMLTTVTCFLALLFMRYTIGFDIGIVLSKGILLSYLSVIILTPILIYISAPLIDKTMHNTYTPSLNRALLIINKGRFILLAILIITVAFTFHYQNKTTYTYGNNFSPDESSSLAIDNQKITDKFGVLKPILILVPHDNDIAKEAKLVSLLNSHSSITKVESLITVTDSSIPRDSLPDQVIETYIQNGYMKFLVQTDVAEESPELFELSEYINETLDIYYEEYFALGYAVGTAEIKAVIVDDTIIVTLFSIIAIAIVLFVFFQNILIPVLLIIVIKTSIWLNFALLYVFDVQVIYIGVLIVLALQLGATIDYAVLLASRYLEFRKTKEKIEALKLAINNALKPIVISSVILAVAGFSEMLLSDIQAVSEIGLLIGRGALLSLSTVLLFLPPLLLIFDRFITKTNKKASIT